MKNANEKELTIEQEVTRDCPILFRMHGRPCSETCISFGFECGEGWHKEIADTCRELETLNAQVYPKYRVRIQADQIKSKYADLRFYYSVVVDPNKFVTWLGHKFEAAYDWLNYYKRFDYKMKKVVDVEPFDYDKKHNLTKEQYEQKTSPNAVKCSNVEYHEENGSYYEICHLHNYGKSHLVPTKHKAIWHVKEFCNKARGFFLYHWPKKDTAEVRNWVVTLDRAAERLIRLLEQTCAERCEWCGHQIGTKWSPECMKIGWWTRLCDDCAEQGDFDYIKNDELWHGDKMILNKEETDKKFHKNQED